MTRRPSKKEIQAEVDERAAIREFDGGMSREDAEAAAWDEVLQQVEKPLGGILCGKCGGIGVAALGLCGRCYRQNLRQRHRIKTRCCAQCQQPFQTTRSDAFLCSAKCRKRAQRTVIRDGSEAVSPILAKVVESAQTRPPATGPQNLPPPITSANLPVSDEDPIESHYRELAKAADARNATPHLHICNRVKEMIAIQHAEMQREKRLASLPKGLNGRVFGW